MRHLGPLLQRNVKTKNKYISLSTVLFTCFYKLLHIIFNCFQLFHVLLLHRYLFNVQYFLTIYR